MGAIASAMASCTVGFGFVCRPREPISADEVPMRPKRCALIPISNSSGAALAVLRHYWKSKLKFREATPMALALGI